MSSPTNNQHRQCSFSKTPINFPSWCQGLIHLLTHLLVVNICKWDSGVKDLLNHLPKTMEDSRDYREMISLERVFPSWRGTLRILTSSHFLCIRVIKWSKIPNLISKQCWFRWNNACANLYSQQSEKNSRFLPKETACLFLSLWDRLQNLIIMKRKRNQVVMLENQWFLTPLEIRKTKTLLGNQRTTLIRCCKLKWIKTQSIRNANPAKLYNLTLKWLIQGRLIGLNLPPYAECKWIKAAKAVNLRLKKGLHPDNPPRLP